MQVVIDRCPNGQRFFSQVAWERFIDAADRKEITLEMLSGEAFRSHPIVIKAVRELGDKVNGTDTKFKIVTIPDHSDWEIVFDYDYSEVVRITVK